MAQVLMSVRCSHNARWTARRFDFTFKTDPLEASTCDFAVMGTEVNGKYYEPAKG